MNTKENHIIEIFNDCFNKHHSSFIRFARSYLRDSDMVEDIVYEAFADVWEIQRKGVHIESLPAYTLGIVKFKCLNYLRHEQIKWRADEDLKELYVRQNELNINSLSSLELEIFYSKELENSLLEVLKELSGQSRQIFILSRYEQLSNKEIATKLGISVKGVEFHITKTIKLLRKRLKEYLLSFLLFLTQMI